MKIETTPKTITQADITASLDLLRKGARLGISAFETKLMGQPSSNKPEHEFSSSQKPQKHPILYLLDDNRIIAGITFPTSKYMEVMDGLPVASITKTKHEFLMAIKQTNKKTIYAVEGPLMDIQRLVQTIGNPQNETVKTNLQMRLATAIREEDPFDL
jgi:hypothetical protein